MNELIIASEPKTITTLEIAEMMEMKHYQILEKLEGTKTVKGIIPTLGDHKIMVSDYFIKSTYLTEQNKEMPCYALTKDGFTFVVMGFTGREANEWKIKYIKAFNEMEAALRNKDSISNTKKHLLRYQSNKKKIPNGYFSMIEEAIHWVILPLELDGKDLIEKCLPDSSLGQGFCLFLKDKGFDTDKLPTYRHTLDSGRIVNAKLYPDKIHHLFKEYARTWVDGNGKKYFQDRTKRLGN